MYYIVIQEVTITTWYWLRLASGKLNVSVTSLSMKKQGRLGEKIDEEVAHYLRSVCEGGGAITTAITTVSVTAIV